MSRRLLYPRSLYRSPRSISLSQSLSKVADFRTLRPQAYRIPLLFDGSINLLVSVSSRVGSRKNWIRAGCLAQVLSGVPGDPKKQVSRLYLDERFLEFQGSGHKFYFEFWPYRWLTDYRLEIWAQMQITI